jgi:hypothetical protein
MRWREFRIGDRVRVHAPDRLRAETLLGTLAGHGLAAPDGDTVTARLGTPADPKDPHGPRAVALVHLDGTVHPLTGERLLVAVEMKDLDLAPEAPKPTRPVARGGRAEAAAEHLLARLEALPGPLTVRLETEGGGAYQGNVIHGGWTPGSRADVRALVAAGLRGSGRVLVLRKQADPDQMGALRTCAFAWVLHRGKWTALSPKLLQAWYPGQPGETVAYGGEEGLGEG